MFQLELHDAHLSLRSINSLTDSEAIEVAKMYPTFGKTDEIQRTRIFLDQQLSLSDSRWINLPSHIIDYLRSIGIALPFMGLSVNQLIEAGVLKIREGGESVT